MPAYNLEVSIFNLPPHVLTLHDFYLTSKPVNQDLKPHLFWLVCKADEL